MKRFLLCPSLSNDKDLSLTQKVNDMLRSCGVTAVICPFFEDSLKPVLPEGLLLSNLEDELPRADMVITFGGDGTILRAARAASAWSVPVLGVNMGAKGFMAEIEKEDIALITKAVGGDYEIDRRMMLDVELLRNGSLIYEDFAVNDVVVAGITKVIDLMLYGDGQKISHFSGDGVIIATPTGSTAYSMSAGGPIVEPSAENILMTPICAHVLTAKAFVLASDRVISIELGPDKANPAYLSVDGGFSLNLCTGDVIKVHKSGKETLLVQLSDRSFYKKVSEKLGEKL